MVRDSQRKKVYAWENTSIPLAYLQGNFLSTDECYSMIELVCEDYGVPVPMVSFTGRSRTYARASFWKIVLPPWARTPAIMLHEVAHVIAAKSSKDDGHGPGFMRLFIELLSSYLNLSAVELRESARKQKVKVAPANAVIAAVSSRRGRTFRKKGRIT